MDSIKDVVTQKLKWAEEHPLCFFPYTNLDLRLSSESSNKLKISCCCNLENAPTVEQITPNPFANLKESFEKDNKLPIDCIRCIKEERTGGVSERVRDILARDITELEEFAKTRKVKEFELRVLFSNVCNLSCRSCEPYSSSTYAKITANNVTDHLEFDISKIDAYWNLITQTILTKIDDYEYFYVHFMGGEPILHDGNKKLVDWLIENQLNKRVNLRITTSINIPFKKDFLSKIDSFRGVDFLFSIDSVYENYHYVRWPAKFEKTIANLNEIVEYKQNSNSETYFNYILSPVFSLNNIFYLEEYLDFWNSWLSEKNASLFFLNTNLLYRTKYLDIQALPIKYRNYIDEIIGKCLEHPILANHANSMQHLYNFLISAQKELIDYPEDTKLWDAFLTYTADFDVRTNTRFEQYNSKLYQLLTESDKTLFEKKLAQVNKTQKVKFYY